MLVHYCYVDLIPTSHHTSLKFTLCMWYANMQSPYHHINDQLAVYLWLATSLKDGLYHILHVPV